MTENPAESAKPCCERFQMLEARLQELETDLQTAINRDIPLLKGTIQSLLDAEIDTIEDLPAAGRTFHQDVVDRTERLEQIEARLKQLDQYAERSTKAEKIATVVAFARNKAGSEGKVAVTPAEIRGCTGVSRRYAYDLLETIADELAGVEVRHPTQVTTGSGTKRKPKALLVDCDVVHTDSVGVNSFTTSSNDEGGGSTND